MRFHPMALLAALIGYSAAESAAFIRRDASADKAIIEQARHWTQQGKTADDTSLSFLFAVRQKNLEALTEVLNVVSDPSHENYGDYLSFEQIGDLLGDEEAAAKVAEFLSADDAITYDVHPNLDFIKATMPVASAERLFRAEFNDYKRKDIEFTVARSSTYSLPSSVSEYVDFVDGVTNFPSKVGGDRLLKEIVGSKAAGDSYPSVVNKHYKTEQVTGPFKGSAAVFETGQYVESTDLTDFETTYGVPKQALAATVGSNEGFLCGIISSDCDEASLDVEYLIAVAQGVPLTFWEVANSQDPFVSWAAAVAAEKDAPLVHSISYGAAETEIQASVAQRFDQEVQKLGVRGITVMVASGDDGAPGSNARGNPSKCGITPSFPAACPHITSVGATQGPEAGKPEIAESSSTGGLITTGGGFSTIFKQPTWQASAVNDYLKSTTKPTGSFNAEGRGYPDVGMMGHNYEITIAGKTMVGSGTSAASPVFAGMVALVNHNLLAAGKPSLGFLNPALYALKTKNPTVFNGITSGLNDCAAGQPGSQTCCPGDGFTADPNGGWAPLDGLGSIDYPNFLAALGPSAKESTIAQM